MAGVTLYWRVLRITLKTHEAHMFAKPALISIPTVRGMVTPLDFASAHTAGGQHERQETARTVRHSSILRIGKWRNEVVH